MTNLVDSYSRRLNYMRISVTDRCNLRCKYCVTGTMIPLTHDDILRYEEIHKVVLAAAGLGVKKVRLTGGEPLVRLHLDRLIELLSTVEGIDEITMTTNGTLLAKYASELKAAGLKRVNISLDTFQADKFQRITGSDRMNEVLEGIEAARNAGLNPVKINMVVLRGINDDEILDFARKTITDGWHVRFIEYMPFTDTLSEMDTLVPNEEIMEAIQESFGEMVPYYHAAGNGPAKYYQLNGASGTLGFIGAVTECFCAECNRFRLTADGKLRPCLLDNDEIDIRESLRNGASIDELAGLIQEAALIKRKQHHLSENMTASTRPMRQIGG